MQAASEAYKKAMHGKWKNNQSYIRVTIGMINQEAQAGAYVPEPGNYAYYSDLSKPMDNYKVTELYATCDQDYTTVDGSIYFLPRDKEEVVLNAGIVSAAVLGAIEIRFPIRHDIKGLTIEFGKAYPVDFRIESDSHTVEITGNADGHFVTEEIFTASTYLRFVPAKMVNGQSRFRIHQITMGIGIYFDNRKILSATKKERISPIMEELPTMDFSLKVNNKDRAFDIENEESSVNFLEIGQDVEVLYGYELDDGAVEWMPGATLQLKEWSADDNELSLSASDRFDYMDGIYYRGQYYEAGKSLYDLAVDVFDDAQVDSREYWIDPYLKDVKIENPIPVVTHKEALQLIANAGRCILYQDRAGNIFMKSSFIPDMAVTSENEIYSSHAGRILDGSAKDAYAMTAQDYTDVKPTQYFMPRQAEGTVYLNTGYISEAVAGEDGTFVSNPTIEITLEAAYKCFGLTLEFGRNHPEKMVFHAYYNGDLREDYEVSDLSEVTVISHEFPEFDKLVLEFTAGAPHNRVILDNLIFGDSTDYTLEYGFELTKTPKGTQLPKVRELQVIRTVYNQSDEVKELAKETISVTPGNNRYTFYFNNPSYDLICEGIEPVSITNLIKNGGFDTGVDEWTNALYDSALKCAYVVSSNGGVHIMSQTVSLMKGHKYYLRGDFMRKQNPTEYSGNDEYDALGGSIKHEMFNINIRSEVVGGDGKWHKLSVIDEVLENVEANLRVYTFGDKNLYADKLALVDLTAAFGAGKEPDKEWCDEYIGFFNGTTQIPRYGCKIIDSSSYYATVELTNANGIIEVAVSGREYITTQSKVSRQLNPTGSVEVWENPLLSGKAHATDLAAWVGDYLAADRDYDLTYRGEPRIDANDIAFLENKYVPDMLIRIYEHTLKFNGALSGTIKARRDMSGLVTTKNRLEGK